MIGKARAQMETARGELEEGRVCAYAGRDALGTVGLLLTEEKNTKDNAINIGHTAARHLADTLDALKQLADTLNEGIIINEVLIERGEGAEGAFSIAQGHANKARALIADVTGENPNEASETYDATLSAKYGSKVVQRRGAAARSEFDILGMRVTELIIVQLGAAAVTLNELTQQIPTIGKIFTSDNSGEVISYANESLTAFSAGIQAVDNRIQGW